MFNLMGGGEGRQPWLIVMRGVSGASVMFNVMGGDEGRQPCLM